MADAQGAFVTRSFEKLLKDSGGKKFPKLQFALKAYLDRPKDDVFKSIRIDSEVSSPKASSTSTTAASTAENTTGTAQDNSEAEVVQAQGQAIEPASAANVGAAATMAEAGHSLQGSEAELIVLPLRIAIETKQSKLIETALDCLHKLIAYGHLEGEAGLEGGKNGALMTELFQLVCNCSDNTAIDSVVLQVIKVILTAIASSTFQVHGECLVLGIRTCYNIVLNSKSNVNLTTAKATLTQMINIVFKRMELLVVEPSTLSVTAAVAGAGAAGSSPTGAQQGADPSSAAGSLPAGVSVEEIQSLAGESDISGLEAALGKAVHPGGNFVPNEGMNLEDLQIGQRDALLVFRTLCKMAMKEGNDDLIARTKILSLELLQGLLESVSVAFTINFVFIDSIKMYLCYALVRAYVSTNEKVFQLACNIFGVLIRRYRESLKAEIGLFFPLVVLRSLDSADSPVSMRATVLKMLEGVTSDPQMLADVFVNYDCDLDATNLYERMVNSLSRIAQGSPSGDPATIALAQNSGIKASSLQCLVNVLHSLVAWNKKDAKPAEPSAREDVAPDEGARVSEGGDVAAPAEDGSASKAGATDFGKAKAHKTTMEACVTEFNMKPKKGLALLEANNLVPKEPAAIAHFLRTAPGLNKTVVGTYLGQHGDFEVAVMHAYVDSMGFKGLKFDAAIRVFLTGFRLPGEANQIDRIMEKFAERSTADTAYILAYAVIMLNTDAHNPAVSSKMTKSDFVRINSGVDGEDPAPTAMLEEIYDSIVTNEIKLKDEAASSAAKGASEERSGAAGGILNVLNLAAPKRKPESETRAESEDIVARTKSGLARTGGAKRGLFHTAREAELARPMIEAVGWPLLAAFSVTMEDGDSRGRVHLCMDGFRLGFHLTKVLQMETMRYAYLTSLVRFTFLHAPKEMRTKNMDALRTLLFLAEEEPDALQVFVNTVHLPSDAIVEFFTALCGVSADELRSNPPRVFSLQKLVEISYYNMTRIRMVWARIWVVLSAHFVAAGGHADHKIAMYAIDSLRQLAMKYLERAELANFTFQNDIMKPFVVIMRTSKVASIRELVVQCIVQSGWRSVFMVLTTAAADVLESIVENAFENVEQVVLEHFDQVVGDCFMDCVNCLIAFANNKISPRISLKSIALLRICEDRLAEVGDKSPSLPCPSLTPRLRLSPAHLCRPRVGRTGPTTCQLPATCSSPGRIPGGASRPVDGGQGPGGSGGGGVPPLGGDDLIVAEFYWFPMLAGLSDLTSDPRTEVRNCALEVLFDLLKERGHKFSPAFWESVFERVLFPIFDYVRHAGSGGGRVVPADQWLRETSIHCLHLLCDLFCTFYSASKATQPLELLGGAAVGAAAASEGEEAAATPVPQNGSAAADDAAGAAPTQRRDEDRGQGGGAPGEAPDSKSGASSDANGGGEGGRGDRGSAAASHGSTASLADSEATEDSRTAVSDADDGDSRPQVGDGGQEEGEISSSVNSAQGLPRPAPASALETAQEPPSEFRASEPEAVLVSPQDPKAQSNLFGSSAEEPAGAYGEEEEQSAAAASDVVRTKCYVQLLLLCALDTLQAKHWEYLGAGHKRQLLEAAEGMLQFAAQYNTHRALRQRMGTSPADRPPPSLLRQEIAGTQLYLTTLFRVIGDPAAPSLASPLNMNGSAFETTVLLGSVPSLEPLAPALSKTPSRPRQVDPREAEEEASLREEALQKLLAFVQRVLEDAASLQPGAGESVDADVHRTLAMRAPVVSKVLRALAVVENSTFEHIVTHIYPYCTRLICSDQMEVRRALGALLKSRLLPLLPQAA
eukprot:jgi/Mesen1/2900/ME000175S02055